MKEPLNPISFAPVKVIAYSIFGDLNSFELPFYLRGLYFNSRMNKLIYPDWQTWVYVQDTVYNQYESYFNSPLLSRVEVLGEAPLCESMLWRMRPLFTDGVTHLLCRDADAITTYREAKSVESWLQSGRLVHAILDNTAHSGLMGGMIGFKASARDKIFKNSLIKPKWDDLVVNQKLSQRGSDQHLLNRAILPLIQDDIFWSATPPTIKDSPLWESNLCAFFIGAAGVNELETIRFFKRFDKTDYSEFEKQHSDICYWQR